MTDSIHLLVMDALQRNRPVERRDVADLVRAGDLSVRGMRAFLQPRAPDPVERFEACA
jgi:hypothetical protein